MKLTIVLYLLYLIYEALSFEDICHSEKVQEIQDADYIIGAFIPAHIYNIRENKYKLNYLI